MQWRHICITRKTSVFDTMAVINQGVTQTALVVTEDGVLLGTVSDGDVRRAILQGYDLQTPVEKIMNAKPVTVSLSEGHGTALVRLRVLDLRYIPVLDEGGRVVDFWYMEQLLRLHVLPNPVMIMAGGLGTRLAPLTEDVPKPMLPVGGRPLLEHILEHFVGMGFRQFYFSVNYKAEYIENYFKNGSAFGVSIDYIHEDTRMGTAGALSLLPKSPELPMVVMNGDILTRLNVAKLLQQHMESAALATMVVREHIMQIPYGVVSVGDAGQVLDIEEKPQHKFWISAGINVLSPEALDYLPAGRFFDMPDLFTRLAKANKNTRIYAMHEYWLDIGRIPDYKRANEEFAVYAQPACP